MTVFEDQVLEQGGYLLVCQRAEQALDDFVGETSLLVVVDQNDLVW